MEKPFVFGVPADNVHFIGRESEIERLSANMRYGVNTVLMSPRRWGKTSLVNKVAESFSNDKERIIIRMDIFACRSEYDFYNVFIYLCHVRAVPQIKGFCLFGWQKNKDSSKKL